MGELGENIKGILTEAEVVAARRTRPSAPSGWEPGVAWDGTKGTLTTSPLEKKPDNWDALLAVWDLDPKLYEVVEPVQYRAWDSNAGEGNVRRLYYYRATIQTRRKGPGADVEALSQEIRRHRKPKYEPKGGPAAFIVAISDPQIGKEGTDAAVARWLQKIDAAVDRLQELRKAGRQIGKICIFGMGDVVEQCFGHYPMQAFTTELNNREQRTLARRLIVKTITALAPLAPDVLVAAIPGNHGEERVDGKASTDFGDNQDTELFDQAAEILAANPETYGHVKFVIPRKQLTITLEIAGQVVGLAHGHQAKSSGPSAAAKIETWWKGQQHGMRPVGDATILITGHYHHFSAVQNGPRLHLQCPTLDSGSSWYAESAGPESVPGLLTLVITAEGWQDLAIL